MSNTAFYTIKSGPIQLTACPAAGGIITELQYQSRGQAIDILKPYRPGQKLDGKDFGCFPMLPYTNRFANGELDFEGTTFTGFPLYEDEPNSMHGDGWQRSWALAAMDESSLTINLSRSEGEMPYRYAAVQKFTLDDGVLTVEMRVTNKGERMPFAMAQHPYFLIDEDTVLMADVKTVQLCDAEMRHKEIIPVPPHWDLSRGVVLSTLQNRAGQGFTGKDALDNCLIGLEGTVKLFHPGQKLEITITPDTKDDKLMICLPPSGPDNNFVILETTSNYVDQFNLAAQDPARHSLPVILDKDELYVSKTRYRIGASE